MKVNVASDQCKEKGGEPLLFDDLKLICKYPPGQLKSVGRDVVLKFDYSQPK